MLEKWVFFPLSCRSKFTILTQTILHGGSEKDLSGDSAAAGGPDFAGPDNGAPVSFSCGQLFQPQITRLSAPDCKYRISSIGIYYIYQVIGSIAVRRKSKKFIRFWIY